MPKQNNNIGLLGSFNASQAQKDILGGLLGAVAGLVKEKGQAAWQGMDTMDKAALTTSPIPILGDLMGLANDTRYMAKEPSFTNAGMMALGALPFVPSLGMVKAYHGSPHKFDRFSMDKIGTGEGAQAYGHGLYFAENPKVAGQYAEVLSEKESARRAGLPAARDKLSPLMQREKYDIREFNQKFYNLLPKDARSPNVNIGSYYDIINMRNSGVLRKLDKEYYNKNKSILDAKAEKYKNLKSNDPESYKKLMGNDPPDIHNTPYQNAFKTASKGILDDVKPNLYNVHLNVEPEDLLDWDAPLSEQSEKVREALKDITPELQSAMRSGRNWITDDPTGSAIYDWIRGLAGGSEQASARLKELGIPGVRYFDGMSRQGKEGTRNYVIFDDKLISIDK